MLKRFWNWLFPKSKEIVIEPVDVSTSNNEKVEQEPCVYDWDHILVPDMSTSPKRSYLETDVYNPEYSVGDLVHIRTHTGVLRIVKIVELDVTLVDDARPGRLEHCQMADILCFMKPTIISRL